MTFKEKLIILRKNKGLTQDDFAKAIGVSRQSVYKWESGASYPEVPKLLEIKALFGISLDELFDESFEIAVPEKKKRRSSIKTESVVVPKTEEKTEEIKPEPISVPEEKTEDIINDPVNTEEKEEEKSEVAEQKTEEPAPEIAEKKIGFFGRLFGRK